ncbi:PREDICTED: phosphatidate phosphatase PAH2-like isoform X2 [Nicotiana attenuata]|uniref:phosphatidate phosphatase PAH2-like isoform X2 n=1 Tax=Nicotiana attenuata TaxID=49451 RepID=UPI0009051613|nr:PREDICTED: phosphatidate phosphatase PAH2-like isoform X2 [Nicotiana attenuata]
MNTMGRIGSYIGRGVSSVSGTFHPFGGAVDIIVVEQPDGSFKSSPWYVRFGKFQGVLKAKEKVVHITVNGIEAGFHMYLDNRGQAFFLKELDIEDGGDSLFSTSSSGEDTDGQTSSKRPTKSKSCNYDAVDSVSVTQINVSGEDVLVRANSRKPGILGRVFGRKSMKNDRPLEEDTNASVIRADSLECAEMAADLLEMKWSTNLTPKRYSRDYATRISAQDMSKGVKDEDLQINDTRSDTSFPSHDNKLDNLDFRESAREKDDGNQLSFQAVEKSVKKASKHVLFSASENAARVSTVVQGGEHYSREESLKSSNDGGDPGIVNADHDARGMTFVSEVANSNSQVVNSAELEKHDSFATNHLSEEENEAAAVQSFFYCETEENSTAVLDVSIETEENSTAVLDVSIEQVNQNLCASRDLEACMHPQTLLSVNDLMSVGNSQPEEDLLVEKDPSNVQGFEKNENCFKELTNKICANSTTHCLVCESGSLNSSAAEADFGRILPLSSSEALGDPHEYSGSLVPLTVPSSESLEEEQLLFGDIDDCGDTVARYAESISSDYKEKDYLVPRNESGLALEKSIQRDLLFVADGRKLKTVSSNVDIPVVVQNNKVMWMSRSLPNMWSHDNDMPSNPDDLNSSIVLQTIEVAEVAEEVQNISATPEIGGDREKDVPRPRISKKKIMLTTPTSEQLATLNLKEGKNIVVFTFSTAMLGTQQVDARIYLWRWDSKIVISDVDGTITRSDVLGQFMPLVGMDWSHTGVAHLFSAIKENGYHLLFLSARAISQAYLTRQFLFKLMQNGKGLPEGPVLTSPDGIFPSLFREVVRRVPHEFKIACLEDVKALFPPDRNPFPFYAGFGNRHTDEISYLKVGIPKGKIFTINPKGQIVVNRHIDTKSYTSLHCLVNGMFPAMSSCEQEDFNSWNFWRLPSID